jgi:hypothetical protein
VTLADELRQRTFSVPTAIARPEAAASLIAGGLVLLAIVIRIWLTRRVPAPWLMGDELLYSEFAESFSEKRHMMFELQPWKFLTIYPAVVSPAWLAGSMGHTYELVKTMNAVLMCLVAVPVYLWSRRLVSPLYAVLAMGLVLLMPAFIYVNEVMTESLAFPLIVLAFFLIALTLEHPTIVRQVTTLVLIGAASTVRLQALVLLLVLPAAILLKALLDARAAPPPSFGRFLLREISRYWAVIVLAVAAFVAYVGYELARGRSVYQLLGPYQGVQDAGYTVGGVAKWVALHFAELPFAAGLLPASAFIVVTGVAWRRNAPTSSSERAFLAVAMAATLLIVLQVGAYASWYSERIEERNMFYVVPFFLIALVMWLDKGLPRPPALTAAAALVPAALIVMLPLERLLAVTITSDTFSLEPLLRVSKWFHGADAIGDMRILLGLGVTVVAVVFACLPRRLAAVVIPVGVAAFLALSSGAVLASVRLQALVTRGSQGVPTNELSWVDDRVGTGNKVVFVNNQSMTDNAHAVWQAQFWNRSIESVVNLVEPQVTFGRGGAVDRRTGRILTKDAVAAKAVRTAPYAVAPAGIELAGSRIAQAGPLLSLYRVDHPLRVARSVSGLYADGWTSPKATITQYATAGDRPGRVVLRLLRPIVAGQPGLAGSAAAKLDLGRVDGPTVTRSVALPEGQPVVVRMATPGPPFRLVVSVAPPFVPTAHGYDDARELGAKLAYRFVPAGASQ